MILCYIIYYNIIAVYYIQYWGLGIGDWGLGPIPNPNPQSPIPNRILMNSKVKDLKNSYKFKI